MPQVSVIIATYNHAGYLGDAVESVMAQTFGDFELLIVDDGSTDDTPAVLGRLAADHPGRFRFVRQANGGVGAAMNRGLAETAAPLVAFLDSDDTWAANHLATLAPMLDADPGAAVAFGRRDAMGADGRLVERPGKPFFTGQVTAELFRSMFISKICLVARREAIERAGRFDTALRMGEDYELLLRLSRLGRFAGTEETVAHRRRHGSNLTADTPAYRVRTAALLERFYFKLDGWRAVEPAAARTRLSHLHYAAGKKLLLAGDGAAARFHLARAAAFRASLKVRSLQALAAVSSPFKRRHASPSLPEGYQFISADQAAATFVRAAAS